MVIREDDTSFIDGCSWKVPLYITIITSFSTESINGGNYYVTLILPTIILHIMKPSLNKINGEVFLHSLRKPNSSN